MTASQAPGLRTRPGDVAVGPEESVTEIADEVWLPLL